MAIVSGIPMPQRMDWLICMLQAHFDGSTQDGKVLVLAGYIAPVSAWLAFDDEWQAVLDRDPKREYFHMGPSFRSDRLMRKAKLHYDVIAGRELIGIGCAIPIPDLRKVAKEFDLPREYSNPYFIAWRAVITCCEAAMESAGFPKMPIDFVFDDQTERDKVLASWDYYKSKAPASVRKTTLKNTPSFKDDKVVKPLQAADLIAWWARRRYLENKADMVNMFPAEWTAEHGEPPIFFAELPEAALRIQFKKDLASAPQFHMSTGPMRWTSG